MSILKTFWFGKILISRTLTSFFMKSSFWFLPWILRATKFNFGKTSVKFATSLVQWTYLNKRVWVIWAWRFWIRDIGAPFFVNFSSSKCLFSFIAQIPLHENTTRWQKWGAGTSKVLHICHKYHLPLLLLIILELQKSYIFVINTICHFCY